MEEQAVEGNGPQWSPFLRQCYKGETAPCRSEEGEPCDGSDLNIVFQEGVSFFKLVQKGFPQFA